MPENDRFGWDEMMAEQPENVAFAIGEIRGQLREVIHTMNNTAQKVDAIGEKVILAAALPEMVSGLAVRLSALEAKENRREGATGIVSTIMRSPTLGWIVGGITTIWLAVTGRLDL